MLPNANRISNQPALGIGAHGIAIEIDLCLNNLVHTHTTNKKTLDTLRMTLRFVRAQGQIFTFTTQELMSRWSFRASAYRRSGSEFQSVQLRFLPFAQLHPLLRFDVFNTISEQKAWRWSTRETYWGTIISMLRVCQIPICDHDGKNLAYLKAKAQTELPSTAPPMLEIHIFMLRVDKISLLIIITFFLGQRISDMAIAQLPHIRVMGHFIAITLVEGKVIPRIGPYTLFISSSTFYGQAMLHLMQQRAGEKFLWEPGTLAEATVRLHEMGLENRSVRRGGLQQMAMLRWPPHVILRFSKHVDEPMLMKYLGHGQVVLHDALTMIAVQNTMWTPGRNGASSDTARTDLQLPWWGPSGR